MRAKPPVFGSPSRGSATAGFTLVELLIGATLSMAVMAALLSTYLYLGRGLGRLANQQTLETEARRTLGYFAQDVQAASELKSSTDVPALSATSVSLVVPAAEGTRIIVYYYNDASTDTTVPIYGTAVTMPARSLTRSVYASSAVSSLTLLQHVTDPDRLSFSYYDGSNAAYTGYTDYLIGIKQVSLRFSTQVGNASVGTQTPIYQAASGRLLLRNRFGMP